MELHQSKYTVHGLRIINLATNCQISLYIFRIKYASNMAAWVFVSSVT